MRHDPVKKYIFLNMRSIEETTACLDLDGVLYVRSIDHSYSNSNKNNSYALILCREVKVFVLEDHKTTE